ncbi:hypothetical protein GCM10009819_29310 [Agromyces tropicus]|uniref:DUF2188 domain-containing protein n=1 Tax=Agromyces tropicus TaxID=555371 RepID=A0ABN2URD4_9MICO
MTVTGTRIVERATGGNWVVRAAAGAPDLATLPTQAAAIEAARGQLVANGGGQVIVHGIDGGVRRRISVAATTAAADAGEPLTPQDLADAAGAAVARVRGGSFDADGDGEPDGDDVLNRVVAAGPEGEAKDAIRSAQRVLKWLAAGLAVFPVVPAWVISSDLGGGFAGIFLGTLAWSLGVAVIAFALIAHPTAVSTAGLSLLGLAAFWLSNAVAGALGGTVLNAADPLPSGPGPTGIFVWIGDLLGAAIENYGVLGAVIATALGVLVGWRGAELYRLVAARN